MVDPQDIVALDQLGRVSQVEMVEPILVSEKGIQVVLDSFYAGMAAESFEDVIQSISKEKLKEEGRGLIEIAEEAPIIKLVNVMISQAMKDRASDIHVEPEEDMVRIRFRVDGLLNEKTILSKKLQNAIVSRIKVLAKLDIAENRKPQDGRIRLKIDEKDVDIRVSTFPTVHVNVVMRLLNRSSVVLGLREGLAESDFEAFAVIRRRTVILVTGPTGSGKTTTLYTALTAISSITKILLRLKIPWNMNYRSFARQINPKADITFANGLRGICAKTLL